jgi:UDP-2,4-diacetamido-2,4,6-trideoxy-beta-L-altropyranose hydrolase
MEKNIIIRTDASEKIGTGHFMRCIALSQAWKDVGGKAIFITSCQENGLLRRLQREGFDIKLIPASYPDPEDWNHTKNIINNYPNTWVVLDGYHFDETYQQLIKESGHRLFVIDDMAHLKHYYADIVLNQNLHAEQLHYSCEPYTRLLLGTRYVLLRREFLKWQGWKREIPEVAQKILVTLGGADPHNVTLKVVQALQQVDIEGLEAVVVIGTSNPHAKVLQEAIKQSHIPTRLIHNARNMPELMAWADLAVSSAGTTVWEMVFMKLPIVLIVIAENQILIAQSLGRIGVGLNLGRYNQVNSDSIVETIAAITMNSIQRSSACQKARWLVDGYGMNRVIKALINH